MTNTRRFHRTLLMCISMLLMSILMACQGNIPPPLVKPTAAGSLGTSTIVRGSVSGSNYKIEMPASWNGTLVLFSHGYTMPGDHSPTLALDPLTSAWLLGHGYALAGSSYSQTGWAVEQAFHDQIALLDVFTQRFGPPRRTIAWGESLGGLISAGLVERFPTRFSGALPVCGLVSGGVAIWNEGLDMAFAFKTLLAPDSPLRLTHITDPHTNVQLALSVLSRAQQTTQGRARLALAAALLDVQGWYAPTRPEPPSTDYTTRLANQLDWLRDAGLLFTFADPRTDLERRAGGNPSWNTGVSYPEQLANSIDRDEVQALYRQAGLNLNQDLATLEGAPRIVADRQAVSYLMHNSDLTGQLQVPVLTLHTIGDSQVPVETEQAYASVVHAAGAQALLRQLFVHRANHCAFTAAEQITAFQALMQRVETGQWGHIENVEALNTQAQALGPNLNVLSGLTDIAPPQSAPAFVAYQPAPFLRPFDRRSAVP